MIKMDGKLVLLDGRKANDAIFPRMARRCANFQSYHESMQLFIVQDTACLIKMDMEGGMNSHDWIVWLDDSHASHGSFHEL
jgi:hypothetical protein